MTMVIILLGLGLAVSLAFNFGLVGGTPTAPATSSGASAAALPRSTGRDDDGRASRAEAELEKKRKELDELKKTHAEVKDELKATKKKVFEQKEASASGDDLAKARAEVERQASVQLENTRHELATALTELQKLRADAEGKGKRRREAEEKKADEKPAEAKPQEVITKVIRELSDVEKERIARLEASSASDRKKAAEADRELKSMKAKLERHHKESKHVFKEAELARDKFRAVEMRLNRTLLENDLLHRAVFNLEKKTGQHAEHTSPTAAEIAESDQKMTDKFKAEDKASAEALEKLMNAPATTEEAPAAAAAPAEAPAAAPTTTA